MQRTLECIALAAALAAAGAHAQTPQAPATTSDFAAAFDPRSGDAWMDTWLGDMNRYGARYREAFVDELVRYHGAPRELVSELLATRRWTPADVYMACSVATIIGRPCRYVVDEYERDHAQGWGAFAARMGVKPGSPEFQRLKGGIAPTYARWARPIVPEASKAK